MCVRRPKKMKFPGIMGNLARLANRPLDRQTDEAGRGSQSLTK